MENYVDVDRDLARRRVLELDNNKIIIEKKDPYGFWYVHFERGQMPASLGGSYTSYSVAEAEIMTYLRLKQRQVLKPKE